MKHPFGIPNNIMCFAIFIILKLFYCASSSAQNQDLQDFVIQIDDQYCGYSTCSETPSKRKTPNPFCRQCDCHVSCFVGHNCCPTTAFKYNGTYKEDDTLDCISADLTGRVTNSTKYYNVIGTCSPDYPDNNWRSSCENITDTEPISLIPAIGWSKVQKSAFYRNIHCAGCNGAERVEPFSVVATCDSSDIFIQAQSEVDVYNAAMRQPGCHLDVDIAIKTPVVCYPNDKYLIASCNETGLWKQQDDMIESGCLLEIYKVPVKGKYYNIFCYLCNTDQDLQELLREEPDIKRESIDLKFEAFLDNLPRTREERNREPPLPYVCYDGYYFTDGEDRCFNISCSGGQTFNDIDCVSPIHSNVIGYTLCLELETLPGVEDIDQAEAELYLKVLNIAFNVREQSGFQLTSMTSFGLEHWICSGSSSFKQQYLMSVMNSFPIKREWISGLISDILENTTIKQPDHCGQMSPNYCLVGHPGSGNRTEDYLSDMPTLAEYSKHVLFVPFTALAFCCQILLYDDDFVRNNITQNLLVKNSQLNLSGNDYILHDNGSVTVCLSHVLTQYAVICNNKVSLNLGQQGNTEPSDGIDEIMSSTVSQLDLNLPTTDESGIVQGNVSEVKSGSVPLSYMVYNESYLIVGYSMLLILITF